MNAPELDATTRRLAHYAHSFDLRTLGERSLHECRRRLVDAAACAVAAGAEPFCQRMQAFAARFAGPDMARVWGTGRDSSLDMAAFANGTLVRYLDFSDTYMGTNAGHPSDMIGALVAAAETRHRDGAALIAALVVAYEVFCGLCDAVALRNHAIDAATCAAVGAAAGAGRLLGLDEAAIGQAISLALAPNLHLYNVRQGTLSEWKGCAGPNGARNGVFAALLAREGVTGPTAVVEGSGGLFDVVGAFAWQAGERAAPRIVDTHLKLHPVCYHGQCAVDAALMLRARIDVEEIAAVDVEIYEFGYRMMGADPARWAPATRETADHSLPYAVATALLEGRLAMDAYDKTRLAHPVTRRLMEKVSVRNSAELTRQFPAKLPTRVTIRLRNGTCVAQLQDYPLGHASNRLTDAQLESKFLALCEPLLGDLATRRVLDVLWSCDRLPDTAALVDALCPADDAPST